MCCVRGLGIIQNSRHIGVKTMVDFIFMSRERVGDEILCGVLGKLCGFTEPHKHD